MRRDALVFDAPRSVGVRREMLAEPRAGEVAVRVALSAVSAGTELLVYRGQLRPGEPLDDSLPALAGAVHYPLRYGYAAVGRVEAVGPGAARSGRGQRVFCFHPHASRLTARGEELLPIPEDVPDEDAVFFANMETAVTLALDGTPCIGEAVAVFGQGIVGLLTTALLSRFPLARLTAVDPSPFRRQAALREGATAACDPAGLEEEGPTDLLYELSGDPRAINSAIELAGFGSRIVVGSWYGMKSAPLDLGGKFHRSRLRLIASRVSSLPPELGPRWTRARRTGVAWDMLRAVRPSRLITHRYPIGRAADAYALLDRQPDEALQVILEYP